MTIMDSILPQKEGEAYKTDPIFDNLDKMKNKYAYLMDCQNYIDSIQSLILNCMSYFVNFYKYFCGLNDIATNIGNDYYAISMDGRFVISIAGNVFFTFYTIFDILTKVTLELENIRNADLKYPKSYSSNKVYGDKKDIKNINITGTIFEKSRNISIVENLRNELIHNAVWEMNPKVYYKVEENEIIDKTIYFPDFTEEGHLMKYKNRKRFFSQGVKLNEILPEIYFDCLNRIKVTLERIMESPLA